MMELSGWRLAGLATRAIRLEIVVVRSNNNLGVK